MPASAATSFSLSPAQPNTTRALIVAPSVRASDPGPNALSNDAIARCSSAGHSPSRAAGQTAMNCLRPTSR
jgi:hypothetical protein